MVLIIKLIVTTKHIDHLLDYLPIYRHQPFPFNKATHEETSFFELLPFKHFE